MTNNWLSFPKNTPQKTVEDTNADYVVLIENPFYIKKSGSNPKTPRYRVELALWLGNHFIPINADYIGDQNFNVKYFIKLPPHS